MHIRDEERIEHGVHWKIHYAGTDVTIIAYNPKTGQRKICEYQCTYNYRDGYEDADILEIIRITQEFVEELDNG